MTQIVCGHCGKVMDDVNEEHKCPEYVKFFQPRFSHAISRIKTLEDKVSKLEEGKE